MKNSGKRNFLKICLELKVKIVLQIKTEFFLLKQYFLGEENFLFSTGIPLKNKKFSSKIIRFPGKKHSFKKQEISSRKQFFLQKNSLKKLSPLFNEEPKYISDKK
mgnify:CR=1 FL=1